jgi:hypothetical protein
MTLSLPPGHIPAWVDTVHLCAETCLSQDTVDARVRLGLLPAGKRRMGKTMWCCWSDVDSYLEQGAARASILSDVDRVAEATGRALARRAKR